MKKLLIFIICIFSSVIFSSCKKDDTIVNFALPDGTPALAISNILDRGFEYKGKKIEFNFVQAQSIAQTVSLDSTDLAIMPTVSAATIYNKGIDIKMISNNVFGNLYIVGVNGKSSLDDLKNKIVYTTTGTTISMVKYILDNNNIEYKDQNEVEENMVALSSKNDASEIIPLLMKAKNEGEEAYAVLGEPQVTQAINKIGEELKIIVDIQEEYKKLNNSSSYPQACLVGKASFIEDNQDFIEALYNKLEENETYISNNIEGLSTIFENHKSNLANLTFDLNTIKRCNLKIVKAYSIKEEVSFYVKNMINIDLEDNFFYQFN